MINQLIIAIIAGFQSNNLMKHLIREGFHFTVIDSSGGFLQESTVCLLIGLDRQQLPALLEIIRKYCKRKKQYIPARVDVPQIQVQPIMIEAEVGGATLFSFEVERFEQL